MTRLFLAALAAALLLAACSDETSDAGTPTALTAPTSSPTRDLRLPTFTPAPSTALPSDIALLLETGCFQCDGPATGLIRVTRSPDGVADRELLVSAGAHALYGGGPAESAFFAGSLPIPRETITTAKGQEQYDPHITGIAASADGLEIVVSVCVHPGCGVGMDAWSPDGRVALYRSTDGGDTWADFGSLKGGAVLGVVEPGQVLAYSQTGTDGPPDIFLYPRNVVLTHPETASGALVFPSVLADGTVVWRDRGNTARRTDGSDIFELPVLAGVHGPWSIGEVIQQPLGGHRIAVEWTANLPGSGNFLSLFAADGAHLRTLILDRSLYGAVWVSDTTFIADVSVEAGELPRPAPTGYPGILPAIIDIEAGTISPIAFPFLEVGAEMGRNHVLGVQRLEATP